MWAGASSRCGFDSVALGSLASVLDLLASDLELFLDCKSLLGSGTLRWCAGVIYIGRKFVSQLLLFLFKVYLLCSAFQYSFLTHS